MDNDFLDLSKKMCFCTYITLFIIILFVITPLNRFAKTSACMKVISLVILGYIIYMNLHQINILQKKHYGNTNNEMTSQLKTNIICGYTFTVFLFILFLVVFKELFFTNRVY